MIRLILVTLLLVGCTAQGDNEMIKLDQWKALDDKVIYFGHQSVGANLMDGVRDISPDTKIHDFYIGENRNPISKMYDFRHSIIQATKDEKTVDVAVMKLCYVDITEENSIGDVFAEYVKTMDSLKDAYPDTQFVHVTIPLTTEKLPLGTRLVKRMIKTVLGKNTYDPVANQVRTVYNNLLREHFGNSVFDLAAIESNHGEYTEYGASALLPEYTYDGGHLNELGRQKVAWNFLTFLSTKVLLEGE